MIGLEAKRRIQLQRLNMETQQLFILHQFHYVYKERSTLVQILPKIATRCRLSITKTEFEVYVKNLVKLKEALHYWLKEVRTLDVRPADVRTATIDLRDVRTAGC